MFLGTFQVGGYCEADESTSRTITTQTMTVDDLSSSFTPEQSLAVMHQKDATGRRCHKTVKGGGEAVWPPTLEAALITGLRVYSERHKLHMRHRGRFIGRNHFLSDYVQVVTGRKRSAKQVGSRLQQLKDTCRELEILFLITGSRSPSPRRDSRRRRKTSPRASPRRSRSISPEPSSDLTAQTPPPQVEEIHEEYPAPLPYVPCTQAPEQAAYPTCVSEVHCRPSSAPQAGWCSSDNGSPLQYYSQPQPHYPQHHYQQGWSSPGQQYHAATQVQPQWDGYYHAQMESQPQFVYYQSQYY